MKQKEGFSGERAIVLSRMVVERERKDALLSSLYITDIGYYPHAVNHYRSRPEGIQQYVLIYCVDGKGTYRVGNKEYAVCSNQFFVLPAGQPHSYAASDTEPWTIYWVHFSGTLASTYAKGAVTPQNVLPGMTSRISERNNIFEEIFTTLSRGYDMEHLRYASSLLHHYLASMRYLNQYRHATDADRTMADSDVVDAAIRYMRENIEKKLTVSQLASYTGYSSSHLSALFKQQKGCGVIACLNIIKVQIASALLRSTDMKVNQLCHKVGLDDSYYFSRLFKKHTGMSPQAYREQGRREQSGEQEG